MSLVKKIIAIKLEENIDDMLNVICYIKTYTKIELMSFLIEKMYCLNDDNKVNLLGKNKHNNDKIVDRTVEISLALYNKILKYNPDVINNGISVSEILKDYIISGLLEICMRNEIIKNEDDAYLINFDTINGYTRL